MENKKRAKEEAEKILADPNSDQLTRDLAHIHLAEERASSSSADEKSAEDYVKDFCEEWLQVEAYERGLLALSDEEAMALAVEARLVKNHTQLGADYDSNGKPSPLLAYPKLVKAAKEMIRTNHSNKADAHIVIAFLSRATDHSESVQHFTKAIQIRPKDWRLRSQLASSYMMMDNLSLSLQSLLVAIELAPTNYDKFDLNTRKSKVLFNLDRMDEAKASFEHLLEESKKFESNMTPKDVGHLAVSQYMLCTIYGTEKEKKRAWHHWQQAEAKRNTVPPEISQQLDWSVRSFAQMCMGALDPDFLSHQECHNCRTLVKDPKKCSACKVAVYCSKDCQVAAWKSGHKHECRQQKSDRKTKKHEQKQAAKNEKSDLPPLDAKLDPRKLWGDADRLVRKKKNEEAVLLYVVALFMDFSLDAQDKTLARRAVDSCIPDDPTAIALRMVIHVDESNPLKSCVKAQERVAEGKKRTKFMPSDQGSVESIDQLDRFQFGVAMTYIFHARIMGRCFMVQSVQQAHSRTHKEAFEDIVKLVSKAKPFLDWRRWLTFQYELGYTNFDVAATDEAKRWLGLFVAGLESVRQSNGSLNKHWTTMKSNAEQKLGMIPLLEMATQSGLMP